MCGLWAHVSGQDSTRQKCSAPLCLLRDSALSVFVCVSVYFQKNKEKVMFHPHLGFESLSNSPTCLQLPDEGIYFHIWWLIICHHAGTLIICKCLALGTRAPSAVVFLCHSSQAEIDTPGSLRSDKVKGQNSTGHHL